MARVIFQRASSGFRSVRGDMVRRIQRGVKDKGFDPGPIDGVYGDKTERAVIGYQESQGLSATGKIDEDTWRHLLNAPIPDIQQRCLQLTGDFEGHGFTKVVGNFDGAGLTWGIIGFTLSNGELQKVLKEIHASDAALLRQVFVGLTDELLQILEAPLPEQMGWATQLSLGQTRYRVQEAWEDAFDRLGSFPKVQEIQLRHVRRYWERALRDAERFDLSTEAGLALCFDIAVQNGGVDSRIEAPRIERKLHENPPTTERDKRIIIAHVVAENSRAQWVETVRRRKLTIATGQGEVNQARYVIKTWGIDEVPCAQR